MTVDDWPILCQHKQCLGTATPAEWKLDYSETFSRYFCQHHAQEKFNEGLTQMHRWVKLTPNQRPSPVQEVQSGSHDQG